ncbi:hypothetical protein DO225_25320 [Salmonella enterica]|nr:hypothetical protein [Salmonella enterica]
MVVTAATAGQVITVVMVVKVEMPAVTPVEVMEDMEETAVKAETMGETGVKAEMVVQEITHQEGMVEMEAKGAVEEMLPEGMVEMEVREETVITRPEGMALQVEMVVTIRETTTGIIQGMLTEPETETGAVMANTNYKIKTEIHYA